MAYSDNELFSELGATLGSGLRAFGTQVSPKTFAAGSGTLAKLTPVGFNETTGHWQVWSGKTNEITKLLAPAATPPAAGDFTLTVQGVTTAAIAFNATTAAIKSALVVAGICSPEEVTVTETGGGIDAANGFVTIEFTGSMGNRALTVTADQTGISSGSDFTLSELQAGVTGPGEVRGFVWPDEIVLDSDEQVLGQVMLAGRVHYDDLVLPAGETESVFKTALRDGPRALGLIIEGLDAVR